jgi:hypothetical protein
VRFVLAHPSQSGRSRVPLSNRVGRNQAKTSPVTEKRVSASKEVRHEVRIAVALCVQLLQPIRVAVRVSFGHRVLPRERTMDDLIVPSTPLPPEPEGLQGNLLAPEYVVQPFGHQME